MQLSSVRAHSQGRTKFTQLELEDDHTRHIDYEVEDEGSITRINHKAKHIVHDMASTDEVAAQGQQFRARTEGHSTLLQGQTNLHHKEVHHLSSYGDDGNGKEIPSHSSDGVLGGVGFHSHVHAVLRLLSISPVTQLAKSEQPSSSELMQHLTSKHNVWSHAHIKPEIPRGPLAQLSDQQIRDNFFAIAEGRHTSDDLPTAAMLIGTSSQGRTELVRQLKIGAVRNHEMAARLVGAVGKHLMRCSDDCSNVLSTLQNIFLSQVILAEIGCFVLNYHRFQEIKHRYRELGLVALLQPLCYEHSPALDALQT